MPIMLSVAFCIDLYQRQNLRDSVFNEWRIKVNESKMNTAWNFIYIL